MRLLTVSFVPNNATFAMSGICLVYLWILVAYTTMTYKCALEQFSPHSWLAARYLSF